MENILDFLNEIHSIFNKYKEEDKKAGRNINILEIISKDNNEIIICKLLSFLLNPKEYHYHGSEFLNLFLKRLGEKNISDATVETESPTNNNRRIDIVIKSENGFIPIEVKINAKDQINQCEDYYNFSKHFGAKCIYYLTPNGRPPSDFSKGKLIENENLKLISFKNTILTWLNECQKVNNLSKPLEELIRQLIKTIKKFCSSPEDDKMNKEIFDKIIETEENKDAAKVITDIVQKTNNEHLTWASFCKNIRDDESWGYERSINLPEAGTNNALTVTIDDYVKIDFQENFKNIFIVVPENKVDVLKEELEKEYPDFHISEPNESGISITKVITHFLEADEIEPFDLYKKLILEKLSVTEKLKHFCCFIDDITK